MTVPRGHPEAVLYPKAAEGAFTIERIAPSQALASFVDYYWLVRWQVGEPYRQQVIPQPRIQLAAQDGRLLVHGVSREPFLRLLSGTGHVLGAAFRPGGFRPFLCSAVGAISDLVVPAEELLAVDDVPVAARILSSDNAASMVTALEDYLLLARPQPDATVEQIAQLMALVEHRPDITRAKSLAREAAMSLRALQRLFTEYVGIGPKWVIQRCRILDAVGAAHANRTLDLTALAHTLGFSDQAHFTRVFRQVVGRPPAAYRASASGS